MQGLYEEVLQLSDMVEILKMAIYQYNPAIESKDKIALPFLAADCATLSICFGKLRTEILNIHEEAQRDEINPNS